jgi:hypothetical protein
MKMTNLIEAKNLTRKGAGRPKGTPNKTTAAAKEVIAQAAAELGGADRLVEWAKEDPSNEKAFWTTIYTKLLPLQLTGDKDSPLTVEIVRFADSDTK